MKKSKVFSEVNFLTGQLLININAINAKWPFNLLMTLMRMSNYVTFTGKGSPQMSKLPSCLKKR